MKIINFQETAGEYIAIANIAAGNLYKTFSQLYKYNYFESCIDSVKRKNNNSLYIIIFLMYPAIGTIIFFRKIYFS